MPFNPDRTKSDREFIFSHKKLKIFFTLIFTLTMRQLLKQHLKSSWDLIWIQGLRLTITKVKKFSR